ncbi:GDP/GTP exchange factor Sec2p [Rhizoctonia solani AG-3 Rhs1AP]|uniref:GDP/GTP exchange factor Sec2p n=1 Tax=Rhizoctonia solani AG-3 Rhs1AP TaxID=1086054 RepID=A0A0A1UIN5_9AGAM|nr:GDP/GTP exchange factor Sec2p [Rhizoctonia solani AG-3 Rhs1AP]
MSSPPSTSSPLAAVPFPSTESEPETSATPKPEDVELMPEPPKPDPTAEILEQAKARFENQCTPDEELRESVGKLITLCTKLTARISTLEPQLTELQTSLTLTQSNLTLAMANTEMLEDALKHNSHTRDVGWRRSDSTASRRPPANSLSYSTSSVTSSGSIDEHGAKIVVHAPSPQSPPPRAATTIPTAGPGPGESRFFRFRFGSKTPSPTAAIHQTQANKAASPPPSLSATHLTSASLPSLGLALEDVPPTPPSTSSAMSTGARVPDPELVALERKLKDREEEVRAKEESIQARDKELQELKAKLEAEKKACIELEKEKSKVTEEIETLTQSLFEEANKMVADERRKMAEVEALLRETEEERDAVRGAMKVVEGENGRLRELSVGSAKETAAKSEEATRTEGAEVPIKGDGETEVSARGTEWEVVESGSDKVETGPKPESQDAESDTDNGRTSFESARADSATKESSPVVSPASSDDELDEPAPVDDHLAKPIAGIPSLPGSSSDLWKDQVRDRETTPPKTPPPIHTLPVETSPWAEGRA